VAAGEERQIGRLPVAFHEARQIALVPGDDLGVEHLPDGFFGGIIACRSHATREKQPEDQRSRFHLSISTSGVAGFSNSRSMAASRSSSVISCTSSSSAGLFAATGGAGGAAAGAGTGVGVVAGAAGRFSRSLCGVPFTIGAGAYGAGGCDSWTEVCLFSVR